MPRICLISLFLVLFLGCGDSFAKGTVGVGDAIPGTLSAKDQTGKEQSFDTVKGQRGVTLVFVRSLDWCPYCQAQTIELNDRAAEFAAQGYPLVTVSYDSPEKLLAFAKKHDVSITLLSDTASTIINQFGLLNEEHQPGSFAYGIPHPGVFVVGADKTVRAKFFKDGYQDRPEVEEILDGIRSIGTF